MTTQQMNMSIMLNTGEVVDLEGTATDDAWTELQVSTDYAVAAVSIGQFANGKSIAQILQPASGATGICSAYLNRRGEILSLLPCAVQGVLSEPVAPFKQVTFQAGDTIQVMTCVAATRIFSYNVITNTGVHAIFQGTPSGSGNTDLTHVLSGQGLGASLTGQRIVSHFAISTDTVELDSGGGVYVLNDRGLPVGGTASVVPQTLQPALNSMGQSTVNLNFVARVSTNA